MKSGLAVNIALLVICLSCITEQSFPAPQSTPIADNPLFFPDSPGSWWTYGVVRYPYARTDTSVSSEVTIRVVSNDTMNSGLPVARWEISISDSLLIGEIFPFSADSVIYIGQTGDYVMLYRSVNDTFSIDTLLRFPLLIGQTWGSWGWSFSSSLDSIGDVTVPAGIFGNSVHVSRIGGWWQAPVERLEWLKESVGFVKIIHTQGGLINNKIVMLLKEYNIVSTSVGETGNGMQPAFMLAQNFPNPFNPSTEIRFDVRDAGFVSLKIFDLLGREVAVLLTEELRPGSYRLSWDASSAAGGQPGGVYFYRLQAGSFVDVKKLLHVK